MKWSNCIIWAIPRWLRGYLRGQALVIRRSAHTWVPHCSIAKCIKDLIVEEYIPQRVPQSKWLRWFPVQAILFKGLVRRGEARCMCDDCRK